jgi:glycosyltransferase involved in cell wall biosynthesis
MLDDLAWRCTCVGALDPERAYVRRLEDVRRSLGLADRVRFTGPLTGADLEARYAAADLVVLPSRTETYGMVAAEALAHGLPVVASAVGGLPVTVGTVSGGRRPGLLVPPDDPVALATALRSWLEDAELRSCLRRTALERRRTLTTWPSTTSRVARVLTRSQETDVEPIR